MLISALAFLAGICALQFQDSLPPASDFWPVAAVLCACLVPRIPRCLAFAAGGFLWAWYCAAQLMDMRLPDHLEGIDVQVEGTVQSVAETFDGGRTRFRLLIHRYREDRSWQTLTLAVRLNWYRDAQPLLPGERWRFRVRLKQPRGFINPGGFDYERLLFSEGIRATGYVRRDPGNLRLARGSGYWVQRHRDRLSKAIRQHLSRPALKI